MRLRWNEQLNFYSYSQRCHHWRGTSWFWGSLCNTSWLLLMFFFCHQLQKQQVKQKVNNCKLTDQHFLMGGGSGPLGKLTTLHLSAVLWPHGNFHGYTLTPVTDREVNVPCPPKINIVRADVIRGFGWMCVCETVHSHPGLSSHSWIFVTNETFYAVSEV